MLIVTSVKRYKLLAENMKLDRKGDPIGEIDGNSISNHLVLVRNTATDKFETIGK